MSEAEKTKISELIGGFKAEQDERGIMHLATFNKINSVHRLAIFHSTRINQQEDLERRIRLLTETPDDLDGYDREILE